MARITVEDCLEQVQNRFLLVHLANKRSKQLLRGAPSKLTGESAKDNKAIVTSLREIADGEVRFMTEAEKVAAEKARLAAEAARAAAAAATPVAAATGVSALEELFGNTAAPSPASPTEAATEESPPAADGVAKNGHHP